MTHSLLFDDGTIFALARFPRIELDQLVRRTEVTALMYKRAGSVLEGHHIVRNWWRNR